MNRQLSVDQDEPDLERRIALIQSQLERLSAAVEHPSENREHVALMESRLTALTQQCAEILDRWTLTDLRHTRALGEMEARLNNWEQLETRVERDAHERLHDLERKIEQEWVAVRQMLEQPVKQLQEHAASLRETSVATAGSALTGLERAETRLATIQADLSDRMSQISRDVESVMAQLRGGPPQGTQPGRVQNWPLDHVMRLHNELRETPGAAHAADTSDANDIPVNVERRNDAAVRPEGRAPQTVRLLPQSAESLAERLQSVEQAVTSGKEIVRETFERAEHKRRTVWRIAAVCLTIALLAATLVAVRLQRQIAAASARIGEAQQQAEAARTLATAQIAASRSQAEQQVAEARETALRAQIVSEVLVASDLVRYGLFGGQTAPGARGQLLWSRSRGLVFSGSRVPLAPNGSTYQLWLLTSGGAVSAGLLKPDLAGRMSLATDAVPAMPRPVTGVALTLEPGAGSAAPTGPIALSYQPQPAM